MGKRSLWLVGSLLAALILLAWWRPTGSGTGAGAQASIETDPARQQLQRFWRSFDRATELRTRGDWAGAAQLYQKAASIDPVYLERSGRYVKTAKELAPNRHETYQTLAQQHIVEGNYEKAEQVIASYLSEAPQSTPLFKKHQKTIDALRSKVDP